VGVWSLETLNRSSLFQRLISAVLVDRLQPARSYANADKLAQFRHPDAVFMKIRMKLPRHHFGDVTAHAAFLFGQTAPVNDAAATDTRTCDRTDFGHSPGKRRRKVRSSSDAVKSLFQKESPSHFAFSFVTGLFLFVIPPFARQDRARAEKIEVEREEQRLVKILSRNRNK
jgi:hypothetical protein